MKRNYLLLAVFLFSLGSLSAQSFIGKLNQYPSNDFNTLASNDTLKILAILSDFQKDIDDATYGDGKFESIYSQDYGQTILDPLPHDKTYFENHLKFVQNYYKKVSDGKLYVSYTVLDNILTVSQTMRNYTPDIDDINNLTPVAEYLKEVWTLADVKYPNFNFEDYDLFLVFHAGVGKDISLPGSLGNERDLPSVYMNDKSLKNVFGPDFTGFPVGNSGFQITNSAVMPETESREVEGFDGISLVELTTNGLLAATVGSYLGLPDLYNTETGRSAIGRFGLMDGQSIFSYQGIFPPEPSAWEKMFLGWVTPTEISIGNHNLNIVNKLVANATDTTLIKIPINSTEYYLIENRKRDALQDGSKVTYISGGNTYTKTFDKDYLSYIYYTVDTLEGVIIDVDEFDWALPGEDRNWKLESFNDIGLIIWHIDERIISENYESNTINNDRYKRGVAIVEADGIRDIGEEFQTVFGETVIGEGTKEDTWYSSNPADYYENKFSADTKPKAESNSGVNSLITLSNFSDISNRTSFNLAFGSEYIDLISSVSLAPSFITEYTWFNSTFNGLHTVHYAFGKEGYLKLNSLGQSYYGANFKSVVQKPALLGIDGKEIFIFALSNTLNIIESEDSSLVREVYSNVEDLYRTPPVILSSNSNFVEFLVGSSNGSIRKLSYDVTTQNVSSLESNQIFTVPVKQIALTDYGYNAISDSYYWSSNFAASDSPIDLGEKAIQLVNTKDGNEDVAIIQTESRLISISNAKEIKEIRKTDSVNPFILADLKNDGSNYIMQNNGAYLEAFNLTGAEASNFPIQNENKTNFISSPLAVDLNNDNAADIITFTEDGNILAIDGISGKVIDGFPISSGKIATVPTVFTENGRTALGVVTENNHFMSWNISQYDGKKFWTEENGNASNTSSVEAASATEKITEFFPQSKAYNWPNPVYEGTTNIRYFVSEDSKAEVTIFDLAGDLVAKLTGNGIGGFDNEIVWNVKDIQSGVYFAHLEVTSNTGQTNSKIIKIAVIK